MLVAHKLGAPGNPEYAIGAVAEDGTAIVDEKQVERLGISPTYVEDEQQRQQVEVARRAKMLRGGGGPTPLSGRVCVVVDDGVATGATLEASLRLVNRAEPKQVIAAIPVGPPDTIRRLASIVDVVVCPLQPATFFAVGAWYDDFGQVSERPVIELLERSLGGGSGTSVGDECFDRLAKVVRPERFRHEGVGTVGRRSVGHLGLGVRRENQDSDLGGAFVSSQTREDTPSVETGETDVENDDIRHGGPGGLQTQESVLDRPDLSSGWTQADIDQPPHAGGVLDHEHGRPHVRSFIGTDCPRLEQSLNPGRRPFRRSISEQRRYKEATCSQPYQSLSYSDFSDPERAAEYRRALDQVGAQLGAHAPLVIGGREVATDGDDSKRGPVSAASPRRNRLVGDR